MKPASTIAAVLLFVIAIMHALRLVYGWQITVAGDVVPMWVSGVGLLVAGVLAVLLWRESRPS
jgi:uncharacterized protein YhhL (DUF1145 family)